jgi:hypothetical protein
MIVVAYLSIKFIIKLVCIKYECAINFDFEALCRIRNLQIKSKSNKFVVSVGELWLSNSYFNRNFTMLTVCLSNLTIKYKSNLYDQKEVPKNTSTKSQRILTGLLKYVAINIQNTNFEMITFKKLKFYYLHVDGISLSREDLSKNHLNLSLTLENINLKTFYISHNDALFNYLLEDKTDVNMINEINSFFDFTLKNCRVGCGLEWKKQSLVSIKLFLNTIKLNVKESSYEVCDLSFLQYYEDFVSVPLNSEYYSAFSVKAREQCDKTSIL